MADHKLQNPGSAEAKRHWPAYTGKCLSQRKCCPLDLCGGLHLFPHSRGGWRDCLVSGAEPASCGDVQCPCRVCDDGDRRL